MALSHPPHPVMQPPHHDAAEEEEDEVRDGVDAITAVGTSEGREVGSPNDKMQVNHSDSGSTDGDHRSDADAEVRDTHHPKNVLEAHSLRCSVMYGRSSTTCSSRSWMAR
jgi:hypothetical protein